MDRIQDFDDALSGVDEGGAVSVIHDLAQHDADRMLEMSGAISLTTTELTKRVAMLQAHNDRIANHAQGLVSRAEFERLQALVQKQGEIIAIQHQTMKAMATAVEAALRGQERAA